MGCPLVQPKALPNSSKFSTEPLTRERSCECGCTGIEAWETDRKANCIQGTVHKRLSRKAHGEKAGACQRWEVPATSARVVCYTPLAVPLEEIEWSQSRSSHSRCLWLSARCARLRMERLNRRRSRRRSARWCGRDICSM